MRRTTHPDLTLFVIGLHVNRMFELKPEAKTVFGYAPEDKVSSVQSAMHGRLFSQVFDSIFQMLGPDIEFVEEVLEQVGKRHVKMGISPTFFSYMGKALLFAVEEALKRPLSEDETAAWLEVYDSISSEMIRVMKVHGAK